MQDLLPLAEKLGALLKDRHETIAIAESSTGGLISAALLSVPGASAYFLGGAVVYTVKARRLLMDIQDAAVSRMSPGRRPHSALPAPPPPRTFPPTSRLSHTPAHPP